MTSATENSNSKRNYFFSVFSTRLPESIDGLNTALHLNRLGSYGVAKLGQKGGARGTSRVFTSEGTVVGVLACLNCIRPFQNIFKGTTICRELNFDTELETWSKLRYQNFFKNPSARVGICKFVDYAEKFL